MTRFLGAISFLGSSIAIVVLLIEIGNHNSIEGKAVVAFFLILIFLFSNIAYVLTTNFGKKKITPIDEITIENEILKKKIEQKELTDKLNLFNSKSPES